MEFINLIGINLKDDVMLEILEHYDIEVIYDFDRTHENMEDRYWVTSEQNGFQFRFNENKELDVIFLYLSEEDGFTPIDKADLGLPVYETFDNAETSFSENKIPYIQSQGEPGSEMYKAWIKASFNNYTVHYQFEENIINMVTISAQKNA